MSLIKNIIIYSIILISFLVSAIAIKHIYTQLRETNMKAFTGCEYLMIDAATQFGLDKKTFEERIEWTKSNLNKLEILVPQAKEKPLFLKAVYAIRDTQAGKPTGHMVGLDSCASGVQIMSAVMGCEAGARHTGLIDQDRMPDAYSSCTNIMKEILGYSFDIERSDAKEALMTFFYGSEAKPKEIFGEGTEPYKAFFEAAKRTAPEAYDLRNILIGAWQPFQSLHQWTLPDNFLAQVRVMTTKDTVIKVPELNSSFTHRFTINEGKEKGLSLAANVIHSIDAMIVREINRRCNYDKKVVRHEFNVSVDRLGNVPDTGMKSAYFTSINFDTRLTSPENAIRKQQIMRKMLSYEPFEVVCIHDEFKCHPNNMNIVRYWYKEILADLADSSIMENILIQIYGSNIKLKRASSNLGDLIRESNYGIA